MALTLIQWDDLRYGHNSTSGYADKTNSTAKEFWDDLFLTEHDKDGDHKSDFLSNHWIVEEGTYTGNGVDDRDISLADASLDIKFIRVWSDANAYTFFRSEDMAGDNTVTTQYNFGFQANYIQSVGTGTFQVGDSANVNTNLETYYYVVYGVH